MMALKIIWSEFAETQLDEIYEYYEKNAGPAIAKKLLKRIINEPKKLIKTHTLDKKKSYSNKEKFIIDI